MRKIIILALTTGVLLAQNDEFDGWMDTIDAKNQSVQANIADDAKSLQETFKLVQGFWTKRGNAPDGVQLSQQAQAAAGAVLKAIDAKDFDAASAQSIAITRTCAACHRQFRPLS
jgi:hypothetical protein